jgi:acyl transferase domain-containing protein/acyl carrier protein
MTDDGTPAEAETGAASTMTPAELVAWIIGRLFDPTSEALVDETTPLSRLGLTSRRAVELAVDLSELLGRQIEPTIFWEFENLGCLARDLLGEHVLRRTRRGPQGAVAEPIAVVGVGLRLPGATSLDELWGILRDGVCLTSTCDVGTRSGGTSAVQVGTFLERLHEFDADFFGMSPREAVSTDPAQRILLEVAFEAFEHAGFPPDRVPGRRVGVFVGVSGFDHGSLVLASDDIDVHAATGSALSMAANRLSYLYDLRGPSIALDTACSSSLVALHLGCQSLRSGESRVALVGATNVVLSSAPSVGFARSGFLAPDGRCKAFGAAGDGYGRGEGVVVVLLKRLSDALADQDSVLGVIRGTGVNSDGMSNGLTAPNCAAQIALLTDVYELSGVSPDSVGYVEAHGTGTPLGDPIEAAALAQVLGQGRRPTRPCYIGSIKSNIGHLEATAGLAGLLKALLIIRHRQIPRSLHADQLNTHIPFGENGLQVAQRHLEWPTWHPHIRIGVSSFGFGGTNAHVVVEEPGFTGGGSGAAARQTESTEYSPSPAASASGATTPSLFTVSARDAEALRRRCESLADGIESGADLHELATATLSRWQEQPIRTAVVAVGAADAVTQLRGVPSGRRAGSGFGRIGFVFSGQGTQWPGMGRSLVRGPDTAASQILRRLDHTVTKEFGWSLVEELTAPDPTWTTDNPERLQPCLVATQLALLAQWQEHGVLPHVALGHSLGEIAAAAAAGALPVEQTMRIAIERGKACLPARGKGRIAVVALDADLVADLVAGAGGLVVAGANAPTSTLISGTSEAVQEFVARRAAEGVDARLIPGEYAFHSPQMSRPAELLQDALKGRIVPTKTAIPLISTVTGRVINGTRLDAHHWARNLREPVQFGKGVAGMVALGVDAIVEVGPHPALAPVLSTTCSDDDVQVIVRSLRRDDDDGHTLLAGLGHLFEHGLRVNTGPGARRTTVELPRYPWRHACFPTPRATSSTAAGTDHPVLRHRVRLHGRRTDVWSSGACRAPELGGRLAQGSALLSIIVNAVAACHPGSPFRLATVSFDAPWLMAEAQEIQVRVEDLFEIRVDVTALDESGQVLRLATATGTVARDPVLSSSALTLTDQDGAQACLPCPSLGSHDPPGHAWWGRLERTRQHGRTLLGWASAHPFGVGTGAVEAASAAYLLAAGIGPSTLDPSLAFARDLVFVPGAGPLPEHADLAVYPAAADEQPSPGSVQAWTGDGILEIGQLFVTDNPSSRARVQGATLPADPGARTRLVPQDVTDFVRSTIAAVLKLPMDSITTDVPITRYGMDSMMAVEVCRAVERRFGVPVRPTEFLGRQSIQAAVASLLAKRNPHGTASLAPAELDDALVRVDTMSDEEVEQLLVRLTRGGGLT